MIGDRIRLARGMRGMSLRALAAKLEDNSLTAQSLSKYERNEVVPNGSVLVELAEKLGVSLDFLLDPHELEIKGIDFRAKAKTTAKERAQVEAAVHDWVQRYLQIEILLRLESAVWAAPIKPVKIRSVEDADHVAQMVRDSWALGLSPIANVTELLEEKGLKICIQDLPGNVSGLTCLVDRAGYANPVPVVVVNGTFPLERRRMTLLHELGHRLIVPDSRLSQAEQEKAVTRFAASLMMPAAHVHQEIGTTRKSLSYTEIMVLKRLYRVSAAAFVYRLKDLGIISPDALTYIFQSIGRTWRTKEPHALEDSIKSNKTFRLEMPTRFKRLCHRALSEKLISDARASQFLQQPIEEVYAELKGTSNAAIPADY